MGYYSKYELYAVEAVSDDGNLYDLNERVRESLISVSGYSDPFSDEVKWYDYRDDIEEVSERFKDVIIIVTRRGEESEDIEYIYALNGVVKTEVPEIVKPKIVRADFFK